MKYKKSLVFICLLICLFSIASVGASDVNETSVASENQNVEKIELITNVTNNGGIDEKTTFSSDNTNYTENDVLSLEKNDITNNLISMSLSDNDNLSTGTYLDKGPSGYIESDDVIINYKNPIQYKVYLIGNDVINKCVTFDIFDSDKNGEYVESVDAITNNEGVAILSYALKPGHYWIKICSENFNHGSVYNSITIRPNGLKWVKIASSNSYFGKSHYIKYKWSGIFKGYLKLYKGNKLVKKITIKSHHKNEDKEGFKWVYTGKYNTKKLKVGKYTVKIVNSKGKVIKKSKFKISKNSKKTGKKSTSKKTTTKKTVKKSKKRIIKIGKFKGKISKKDYKLLKRAQKNKYQCVISMRSTNYKKYYMSIEYNPGTYQSDIGKYWKKGFYGNVWCMDPYTGYNVINNRYIKSI